MSTKQSVPTVVVQDYEYGTDGQPLANQEVTIRLAVTLGLVSAAVTGGAAVNLEPIEMRTKTDQNGFWSLSNIVRNSDITPGGTYYTVKVGLVRQYQIQLPAGAGPFVASANLLGALAFFPSGSSVAGPITITGNLTVTGQGSFGGALTASAGLAVLGGGNVAGGLTVSGGETLAGTLTMSDAASRLVPGSTSFAIRNNANSADNLLVADNGDVTVRSRLLLVPAASKIVPGATSLSLRNNADSADNVLVTDAGAVTLRNALSIPPSAGGSIAPSSYGSVPLLFDKKTPSSGSTVTFTIPSGFTHLHFRGQVRSSANANNDDLYMQLNGDGGGSYVFQQLYGTANVATSAQGIVATSQPGVARIVAATGLANVGSTFSVDIENYSGTTFIKEVIAYSQDWESTVAAGEFVVVRAFRWNQTVAITSVTFGLTGTFVAGSVISGYVLP